MTGLSLWVVGVLFLFHRFVLNEKERMKRESKRDVKLNVLAAIPQERRRGHLFRGTE